MAKKYRPAFEPDRLEDVLTERALRRAAWGESFSRGRVYFEDHLVEDLDDSGGVITARVRGTRLYHVKLWTEGGEIVSDCSCPVGRDELFCKHAVATGLAWLERRELGGPRPPEEDLPARLRPLGVDVLASIIAAEARKNPRFARSLPVSRPAEPERTRLRRLITEATEPRAIQNYRTASAARDAIARAIEQVRRFATSGDAADALRLADYALDRIVRIAKLMCSSGDVGLAQLLDATAALHLDLCRAARPDSIALARHLFRRAMSEGLGEFTNAAEKYADVMGEGGLAEFRRLAEEAWSRMPVLRHRRFDGFDVANRLNITLISESLARQSGNVGEMARVLARDLSSPARYLRIAELYLKADMPDRALEWAEVGLKSFPKQPDAQLQDFIVERYVAAGRTGDVMNLAWAGFADRPSGETYQVLKRRAEQVGQWPVWREEALELLRERALVEQKKARTTNQGQGECRSAAALVEILLDDGDTDAAWHEARGATLQGGLWLRLAEARAATHPADAVGIYQHYIEATIEEPAGAGYPEATRILSRVAELMKKLGRRDRFEKYIGALRAKHKRRRNLVAMLDAVRWP